MSATDHAELSAAYWEGARRGALVLQQCSECGPRRHYPRAMCAACYSFDVTHVEHDGLGTVHSWTVAHHAFSAETAGDVPYVLVTVDLGGGVRALGRLAAPAQPALGLAVRIGFAPDAAGEPRPVFTAID
jgi:uncharacterized OB-fold protein